MLADSGKDEFNEIFKLIFAKIWDEKEALEGKDERSDEDFVRLGGLDELLERIKTADGAYPQPMLTNQISYLLNMISTADQAPGKEAIDRYQELSAAVRSLTSAAGN